MNQIIRFHHFNIKAQDFEVTTNFYKSLGFEAVHSWSLTQFNIKRCTMMYHPIANIYIEICDKDADMPTQGRKKKENEEYIENAILHICFTVSNAELAYKYAIENGATTCCPLSEIELIDDLSLKAMLVKNALVYSPNGEVIEFIERDPFSEQSTM
ncbi:VOC family protein [Apibacter sp.]|uniref:VOC family protein n=1 Tax=Apibacter sp. TaxID=2023709 RepID=UPI0025F8A1C4|nr:VOC family protein [Apibacter sp.]MCT6869866.1 VOC family protein [Apibacter sp.]